MQRIVGGEVHFDEVFSTFTFKDGLTVSLMACPRCSMAREHWNDQGICACKKVAA